MEALKPRYTDEQIKLARLAARECKLAGPSRVPRAKQRRAVAIYDCLAAGWPQSKLAMVCDVHVNSIMPWVIQAEEFGKLERYRIRLELRKA